MDFSDTSGQNMRIDVLPDGHIKMVIEEGGKGIEAEMTPRQGANMIHDLLKAGVVAWMRNPKNNLEAGGKLPLTQPSDIYTQVAWPLGIALFSPHVDEKRRPAVGIVAAFGDLQVAVGLQRNQLRRLGEQLIKMDEMLPPSDHFELGIGD